MITRIQQTISNYPREFWILFGGMLVNSPLSSPFSPSTCASASTSYDNHQRSVLYKVSFQRVTSIAQQTLMLGDF
jgi:hypothetical protein